MTVALASTVEGERMTIHEPIQPEPPRPLFRTTAPAEQYPVQAMGAVLAEAVDAVVDLTQASPAICANAVLAAASLAVQGHWDVLLPTGQRRPTSLFLLTIAASGERKTSADREALMGVREHERDLRVTFAADSVRHKNAVDAYEAVRTETLKKHRNDRTNAVAALDALGPAPKGPIKPFIIVTEPTIEGLIKLLPDSQPTIGLFSSEGGSFIGGHAMTDEAKLRSAARLSALWDGEPIDRVRSTGDASVLLGRRVALHLMAQPEAAMTFLGDRTLLDQGLLSRVLIAAPDPSAGGRMFRETSIASRQAVRRLADRVLATLQRHRSVSNDTELPTLMLEAESRALFIRWHDAVERELPTRFAAVRGLAAKLPEHAVRIAAVIAAFSHPERGTIDADAMAAGIRLANYYAGEAIRLADNARISETLRRAERLRRWLTELNVPLVHLADIYQRGPAAVREKDEALRLMSLLAEHGYVVKVDGGAEVDRHHRRDVWAIVR